MSHLPWFPFFPGDWKKSRKVRAMPRHCRSMFLDLLGELWDQGPFPDDQDEVAALLSEDPKTFGKEWAKLRPAFFEVEPGYLSNHRLEEIRREQLHKNAKQAKRAKDGWDKRKSALSRPSHGDAAALPEGRREHAISDLRSQNEERESTRAHARETEIDPDPSHATALALAKAWPEVGILGTPLAYQLLDAARICDRDGLEPKAVLTSWLAKLEEQASRGIIAKRNPQKLFENLRDGIVQALLRGAPVKMTTPDRPGAADRRRQPKPIADVLRAEEEEADRLREERRAAAAREEAAG